MNNLSDWDVNYAEGLRGEKLVLKVLEDTQLEIKTDYQWQRTGNIFVETECFYVNENKVKPSALNTSKAPYYAFVLPWGDRLPIIKIIPTELLKKVVKEKGTLMPANQDGPNPTEGYLIKLDDIEDYMRGR